MLPPDIFSTIIKNAPLIAIDLIVENKNNEFLFGLRKNQPAKDSWFVPGGRIFKNETIEQAMKRIANDELQLQMNSRDVTFKGVYEHIYNENTFNDPAYGTHYIVLAYSVNLNINMEQLPKTQHCQYKWLNITEILNNQQVHQFAKNYFTK